MQGITRERRFVPRAAIGTLGAALLLAGATSCRKEAPPTDDRAATTAASTTSAPRPSGSGPTAATAVPSAGAAVLPAGSAALGATTLPVAVHGPRVYVSNEDSNNISVIDPATDEVTATIFVGKRPRG